MHAYMHSYMCVDYACQIADSRQHTMGGGSCNGHNVCNVALFCRAMQSSTEVYACVYMYIHAYMLNVCNVALFSRAMQSSTEVYACVHACMHTYIHTSTEVYAYVHICAYIHAYIHTQCMQRGSVQSRYAAEY